MKKENLYIFLGAFVLINGTSYTFIIPILPDFLAKKGVSLSAIGLILSCYQISNLLMSLYLSKNGFIFSKTRLITLGQAVLISTIFSYSLINYVQSLEILVFFACLLRFLQGFSYPMILSTVYSFVPVLTPEEMERKYAFLLTCSGLGMAFGPVIGGVLYQNFELSAYFLISYVYTLSGLTLLPVIFHGIAKNRQTPGNSPTKTCGNSKSSRKLSLGKALKSKEFWLTVLIFLADFLAYPVMQPGFSEHVHSYNGNDGTVGLIFGIGDLGFTFMGVLVMYIIKNYEIQRRNFFISAGVLTIISLLLLGPEEFTYLPGNLWTVTLAVVLIGFAQMSFIPMLIPEFIEIFEEIQRGNDGNGDLASTLFTATVSVGNFVGLVLGGVLVEAFGFKRAMSVYSLFIVVSLAAYVRFRKEKQGIMRENDKNYEMKLMRGKFHMESEEI